MHESSTAPRAGSDARSLVLVAGSGRSGTSLVTGILQRLGYTVPRPEVPADDTNPRGFGESQWVVDFHTRLLKRARVQVSDARPSAWALTADVALDRAVAEELRTWLRPWLADERHVVIKDPRLGWFLPLWRSCAAELGVEPRLISMLRHPAAVVDSKQRWYGGWQTEVSRTAGWINQTLYTERATREIPRLLVRYDALLADWTRPVGQAGDVLDLEPIRRADPPAMRRVHEFVDVGLNRSAATWGDRRVPDRLRALADETWELMSGMTDGPRPDEEEILTRLDEVRRAYGECYAEAEAIAHSTIAAGRAAPARRPAPSPALRLLARIPARHRRRVPAVVRQTVRRVVIKPPAGARR